MGLYVKNSPSAVELYRAAFGLELGYHVKNEDGTYFHSELMQRGQEVLSVVEANDGRANPVELGVTFETKAGLERAFAVLQQGGAVELEPCELPWSPWAAGVRDRFGVKWYLTVPQHKPDEDFLAK